MENRPSDTSPWTFEGQPALMAHRGYAASYPENTLESFSAALEAGARYLECDIQLTADEIPVLCHDEDFSRTAGVDAVVFDMSYQDVLQLDVCEASRLGNFQGVRVPRLIDVVSLLADWPNAILFVELKLESLLKFRRSNVLERVLSVVEPLGRRCVLISYDAAVLEEAKKRASSRIGWVIGQFGEQAKLRAQALAPEFLICNYQKLPCRPNPFWKGDWHWVLYEIDRPELAIEWREKGVALIETMLVGEMLLAPPFDFSRE